MMKHSAKLRDKETDMKKRTMIFLLAVILAMLAVSFAAVSAQDFDLDNMDDEQLMLLMQAISQKLQKNGASAEEGSDTVTNESSAADQAKDAEDPDQETLQAQSNTSGEPEKQVTRAMEAKKYQIYENKKLIIGRMPDSMFVRKPTGGGGEEEPEPEGPKTPEEEHNCLPGQTYECYTDIFTGEYICSCGNG